MPAIARAVNGLFCRRFLLTALTASLLLVAGAFPAMAYPTIAETAPVAIASADHLTLPPAPEQKPSTREHELKTPLMLAGVGLLLLPVDRALHDDLHGDDDDIAKAVTRLGEPTVLAPVLGSMYFFGATHDRETARLATDALINATLICQVGKTLAGRARPSVAGKAGDFTGPSFSNHYASFPSNHTAAAFSVARVMAKRHPKQKWLYYSLAAAVGFSRIRESAHFPSDVLVGAGVGIYGADQAMKHGHNFLTVSF